MRVFTLLGASVPLALALVACSETSSSSPGGAEPDGPSSIVVTPKDSKLFTFVPRAQLGDPIPGLTPSELAAFERGREVFERRFTPSEGLGPLYNATSCVSCHSTPVPGGSAQLYRNFLVAAVDTGFTQFNFPDLPSVVIPSYGLPPHAGGTFTLEGGRFVVPADYFGLEVRSAQRNGLPIFGVGLFEFVSDATIMSLADPNDLDLDGISGRYNTDAVGIGRLGVKAQSNNIELFTRPPLMNQMGITSNPFEGEDATVSLSPAQVGGDPTDPLEDDDAAPDPEISHGDLGDLIAFTRFLAPPAPVPMSESAKAGELLFDAIGCTACHVPELPSSRGPVRAYTDLLLHDMGPALADGLRFGTPQTSIISPGHNEDEFRTQPLWGVSLHYPWLHDGRAATLEEAILLHAGEGLASRNNFVGLRKSEQMDVIAFLEHL